MYSIVGSRKSRDGPHTCSLLANQCVRYIASHSAYLTTCIIKQASLTLGFMEACREDQRGTRKTQRAFLLSRVRKNALSWNCVVHLDVNKVLRTQRSSEKRVSKMASSQFCVSRWFCLFQFVFIIFCLSDAV